MRITNYLLISLLLVFSTAHSQSVNLSWVASVSPNATGYKIAYGKASGAYDIIIDAGNSTAITIDSLDAGSNYFFAAKAYDAVNSIESYYSNEVNFSTNPVIVNTAFSFSQPQIAIDFTPIAVTGAKKYTWSLPGATVPTISYSTSHVVSAIYPVTGVYAVTLTVTNRYGVVLKSSTSTVTIKDSPLLSF